MMQTQRSNYRRKPASISIWQWSKKALALLIWRADGQRVTGSWNGWQRPTATSIYSWTNCPHRFKNMILKINFVMFLLFINLKRERDGGRGRQASVVIDYDAENIMNWIWGLSFPHTFGAPRPPPDCHNCASVSPGVSVSWKGTFVVSVLLCQGVKRIDLFPPPSTRPTPFLNNHKLKNSFVLVWLCLAGDTKAGCSFCCSKLMPLTVQ